MTFSEILNKIKEGNRVTRGAWANIVNFIVMQEPIEGSGIEKNYIDMYLPDGRVLFWMPHQDDILAKDWNLCLVNEDLISTPATVEQTIPTEEMEKTVTTPEQVEIGDMPATEETVECGTDKLSEQACELGEDETDLREDNGLISPATV